MKKVIFEGVVNDVKFDNVEAYNKAVAEAIAEGEEVRASTKTKMVEEPDPEAKNVRAELANILFPGIGTADELTDNMFKDIDEIHDIYFSSDHDIDAMVDDKVYKEIQKMDEGGRAMYEEDLGQVIKFIADYKTETNNKIEAIVRMVEAAYDRVRRMDSDIKELQKYLQAAEKLSVYYTRSMQKLMALQNETEEEDIPEEDEHEQAIAKLLSLCENIFPDYKKHFDANK